MFQITVKCRIIVTPHLCHHCTLIARTFQCPQTGIEINRAFSKQNIPVDTRSCIFQMYTRNRAGCYRNLILNIQAGCRQIPNIHITFQPITANLMA